MASVEKFNFSEKFYLALTKEELIYVYNALSEAILQNEKEYRFFEGQPRIQAVIQDCIDEYYKMHNIIKECPFLWDSDLI